MSFKIISLILNKYQYNLKKEIKLRLYLIISQAKESSSSV